MQKKNGAFTGAVLSIHHIMLTEAS